MKSIFLISRAFETLAPPDHQSALKQFSVCDDLALHNSQKMFRLKDPLRGISFYKSWKVNFDVLHRISVHCWMNSYVRRILNQWVQC